MRTVTSAAALREGVAELRGSGRRSGARVGFVPTMGALHAGHLSLVELARRHAERVVASIFVNPTQFGPHEDYTRYPRQAERDSELLAGAGCDLLFLPEVETIYPPGATTRVRVDGPSRGLEGDVRPGHFEGVATVVAQLFLLVQPDVAVFGEKDAQQLAVVSALVRELHFPIAIVAGPTVREPDGLALSSRNAYLSPDERRRATVLSRALARARQAIESGERDAAAIRALVRATLAEEPALRPDYVEVVDAASFSPVDRITGEIVVPIAGRLGATRLLDNLRLRGD